MSRPRSVALAIIAALVLALTGCGSSSSKLSPEQARYAKSFDQMCSGMLVVAETIGDSKGFSVRGLPSKQAMDAIHRKVDSFALPFVDVASRFDDVTPPKDVADTGARFKDALSHLATILKTFDRQVRSLKTLSEYSKFFSGKNPFDSLNFDVPDLPKKYFDAAPSCKKIQDGKTPFG